MDISLKTNIGGLSSTDNDSLLWMRGISISAPNLNRTPPEADAVRGGVESHEARFLRCVLETGGEDAAESLSCIGFTGNCGTVDDDADEGRWSESIVDFMRIDAGSQPFPVSGEGVSLLRENSPLVMYDIRQAHHFHAEMMQTFRKLGYDAYRLVPGIGCLFPAPPVSLPLYDLTLYFCKPDRAAELAVRRLLILRNMDMPAGIGTAPDLWIDDLRNFPYAIRFLRLWAGYRVENRDNTPWRIHQEALSSYAVSRMTQLPPEDRFQALYWAYLQMENVIRKEATFSRLMSLVRVASDLGYREKATDVVERLLQMTDTCENISVNEPFLAVSEHFEALDPGLDIRDWRLRSFIAFHERHRIHSWAAGGAAAASADLQPPPNAL